MIKLSQEEQKQIVDRLRAAVGYLERGMADDAWDELESIDAKHLSLAEVLKVRLEICRAMQKWELMAEISQFLAQHEPHDSGHFLNLSYAKRRCESVESAEAILTQAEVSFPEDALIKYNLGCYRAVTGRVAEARLVLAEAFQKDPALRITALDDPDSEGAW